MGILLRVIGLLVLILLIYWIIRQLSSSRTHLKCKTCRHCRKLFHDGSLCGFGPKETFKTIVHVENCMDYQRQ